MINYLKHRIRSFGYAFQGIKIALAQPNMQIHLVAGLLVIAAGIIVKLSKIEWCMIILVISLVIMAETINTSIEMLVDKISPEKNVQAGRIKDLAAGAVLITALASVVVGIIIFLPKVIELF